MQRRLITWPKVLVALLATQASLAVAATSATVTEEIRKMEATWLTALAKRDGATVKSILHPDYIGMSPLGKYDTRADFVAGTEQGFGGEMDSVEGLAEINVAAYGNDTAVAYGPMKDGVHQYHDLFIKEGGKWIVVFSHVSMIPKAGPTTPMPSAAPASNQASPAWAQPSSLSVVREIREMERVWLTAMSNKDGAAVDTILDPGYLGMGPTGKLDTKADFVAMVNKGVFAPDGPWPSLYGLAEINVKLYGGHTAVAYGKTTDGEHWYSDTFKKTDGKWRAIFTQIAPIPQLGKKQ